MSEKTQLDNPEVKSDSFDNQEVKTDSVESNETANSYTVPGHVLGKQKEKTQALELELQELKKQIKEKEIVEAEEKEDWRNLYEETKSERDKFQADAQKFQAIEQSRKERLLESFPENLREKMSALDSDTLEQMKNEFNNKVPQTDNSGGGVSGGKVMSWKDLKPSERRKNFADIMRGKK